MTGLELFRLGRKLMKIGEDAIPKAGFHELPTSVRSILIEVFEHQDSSIGEIAARTGFPQSHVSAAVARLREGGAFVTTVDPRDGRRTLVRRSPEVPDRVAQGLSTPIDAAVAAALGTDDPRQVAEAVAALESLAGRLTPAALENRPRRQRHSDGFDVLYRGTPPWDVGRPQRAFLRLAEAGSLRGRVLDVGCGTGEHALLAANLGLETTGIDAAATAIEIAESKAKARGLDVRFLVGDALDLPALGGSYDTVLDSGLFHVFDDDDRPRFVESLRAVVTPEGRYYMLCFSDRQPGAMGPRRVTQEEIRASFGSGWRVESIEADTFELTIDPAGAHAWLSVITRASEERR